MNVLINGMEMPKCCAECPAGAYEYNDNDERCFVCGFIKSQHPWECEHVEIDGIDTTKARADFCPLIEIPTPHGRLIDADELINELASMHVGGLEAIKKYTGEDTWTSGLHTAWRTIDDADTVIEAGGLT